MADDGSDITDSDIAIMMAMRNEEGLRLLLQRHGGCMKAYLVKYYRDVLQDGELAEALNVAVYNAWRFAERYDEGKGALRSWCIRIAQRAAQSILRREYKYREKNLEYDTTFDPAGDPPEPESPVSGDQRDDARLDALHSAVETLPPLQRAIIKADLAADGLAEAGRLAEIHGTSKNSIYVSRSKAREALKKLVEQRKCQPASKRR